MEDITADFIFEESEAINANFEVNVTPKKLSELENDMGFITKDDIETPDVDLSNLATKTELANELILKQDKLIAGNNILIDNNVISAIGGGGSVDAYTKAETDNLLDKKQDKGDYAQKFELAAPLQYVYDGNIGSAYVFMGTDEITTDEVKATSIQLLKSGDIFTGEYSNFEPDKAWEVSVKSLVLNGSLSSTATLLSIRPTNGIAEINVNENSQVKFYCNFGSSAATNVTGATLSVNTPYDFRISYDGAGKTTLQYKQSSSTTWTTGATRTATLKANSGGSNYNYVRVGNEYTTFLLSNVEFISNNNVLFKHVTETTKYLDVAYDNTLKVVDGKLTTSTKILVTTEADYNALATKDTNTLYLIEE